METGTELGINARRYFCMAFQGDSIFWVEVEKIVPNPYQPRREFDENKLKELADSIRMYGILQPLTVTRKEIQNEDGSFHTEYELIAGERRLRASRLAGIEQVPVIIRSGEQTEQEKLELAIIENLQREDLNSVDRALAFQQLAQVFDLSHTEVAKKVGRSREYVSNSIRLLMLPEYMLQSLRLGDMSEGHARSLLMLKERPEEQDVVFREILLKKLSVREVESITRKIATEKIRKKDWLKNNATLIEMERDLTDTLGTRVSIQKTEFGGKLTIDYFSDEDLEKLVSIVKAKGKIIDFGTAAGDAGLAAVMAATPLEVVSQTPVSSEDMNTAQAVIAQESAVSEVIEDTVVRSAEYAAVDAPTPVAPEGSGEDRYRLDPYVPQWEYVPPAQPVAPIVDEVPEATPIPTEPVIPAENKKDDDDEGLYSIRNFSI